MRPCFRIGSRDFFMRDKASGWPSYVQGGMDMETKNKPGDQLAEQKQEETNSLHLGPKAYIALIVAILYFSGVMADIPGMKALAAFDFTTLAGKFGKIPEGGAANFLGTAGIGARQGFMQAFSYTPVVMLALGCIEVLTHYGALRAAQQLLTPLLHPLLGIPGKTGLALITDLQSTDAGAALTRELYDSRKISLKELIIMSQWQFSGPGMIANYFTTGSLLFGALAAPLYIPFLLILVFKFVGAMFIRFMLNTVYKGDFKDE